MPWALRLFGVVIVLLTAGYPCNFLGCVLRSAANGDGAAVQWTGHTAATALRAGLVWLALAGPAVFAVVAALYWMQCGDPAVFDWLILAELGVLTVGYGLAVLASVGEHGRLRDLNPPHVIDVVHRLGWRAAAATLVTSALVAGHGLLAGFAAGELHRVPWAGALLLAACWLSGMFWATFLFRLLGVWCYRSRMPAPSALSEPDA
jgi:hypothetical protein